MRIDLTRALPVPRRVAWRAFVDVEGWADWSPWTLRFGDEPRFEIGASFRVVVPAPVMPWVELAFPCRVTVCDAPERVRWNGVVFGVPGYHQFAFEDTPSGCIVRSRERFLGPAAALVALARPVIVRRVERFLDDFAAAVLSEPGTAATRRARP